MNILGNRLTADYIHTGLWSGKAIKAAKKYCDVRVVSSSENTKFDRIPDLSSIPLNSAAAYLHYTENETVQGVQFLSPPRNATTPLVCDACSSLMSKTFNIEAHGLIYAAAQKNMGAAGITVVIVSPELLDKASHATPDILNYSAIADANSMLNTPPTFAWYLTGLTLKWIKSKGGLCSIQKTNNHKANSLYATIDNSGGFYSNKVVEKYRSKTNIPFFLREQQLEQIFLSEAKAAGLVGLKGHSTTGGLRASIYNAVAPQAVEALASFMKEFAHRYG